MVSIQCVHELLIISSLNVCLYDLINQNSTVTFTGFINFVQITCYFVSAV